MAEQGLFTISSADDAAANSDNGYAGYQVDARITGRVCVVTTCNIILQQEVLQCCDAN